MKRLNNKMNILVFSLLILITVGYAAISTTLTITGNSTIKGDSNNFQNNVYFYSASLTSTGLQASDQTSAQPQINGNTMTFTIPNTSPLKTIGDKIEVDYTIRNESNYKAIIAIPTVECSDTTFNDYFTVMHSRTSNLELDVNQTTLTQKLTLTLKKTYADTNIKNFTFTITMNATAMEATTNGIPSNVEKIYRYEFGMPDENSSLNFQDVISKENSKTFMRKANDDLELCYYRTANDNLVCLKENEFENNIKKLEDDFGKDNCEIYPNGDIVRCEDNSFICYTTDSSYSNCYDKSTWYTCYLFGEETQYGYVFCGIGDL